MTSNTLRLLVVFLASSSLAFYALEQFKSRHASPGKNPVSSTGDASQQEAEVGNLCRQYLSTITGQPERPAAEHHAHQGAQRFPRQHLGRAVAWIAANDQSGARELALRALAFRWINEAPAEAVLWALRQPQADWSRDILKSGVRAWASAQPNAVRSWSQGLEISQRKIVLREAAALFGERNLTEFAAWQELLPPDREREALFTETARRWAQRDPAEVARQLAKSEGALDGAWPLQLATALAAALSQTHDFSRAVDIIAMIPSGPAQQTVFSGFVVGWANRDPEMVAVWLETYADLVQRAELSALLAGEWAAQDTERARLWARTLPEGPISEAVLRRMAQVGSGLE